MEPFLLRRAAELRLLDEQARAVHGKPEHSAVAQRFRELLTATLAPYEAPDNVDAIEYLELRPRFFRSGYTAENLMRRLSRAEQTPGEARRYRAALEAMASEHPSREQKLAASILARLT
jgi:hypothetical protein